jgi:hypothetical protein
MEEEQETKGGDPPREMEGEVVTGGRGVRAGPEGEVSGAGVGELPTAAAFTPPLPPLLPLRGPAAPLLEGGIGPLVDAMMEASGFAAPHAPEGLGKEVPPLEASAPS